MRHIDGENLMKNMDNKDEDNLRNIVTYMVFIYAIQIITS